MAGTGQAGPTCAQSNPVAIDDGTLCRTQSPPPGSVSSGWFPSFSSIGDAISADYQSAKAKLQSSYQNLKHGLHSDYEGARCLYQAASMAEGLAPAAIFEETGYQLKSILQGLIPGLIQMVAVLGATTFLGAAIGGIVGAFFGGVGAVPGAAIGADLGFDLGMAALTWLGVAFLAVSIAEGFGEMLKALRNGIEWAWYARNLQGAAEEKQVQRAAHELARTVGILVRLILQGILAYLLKKAAVSSTRGAISTIGKVQAEGAAAVSEATVAELVGKLRSSKLGDGFADWIKQNWRDLRDNPKLKPKEAPKLAEEGGGPASDASGKTSKPAPKKSASPSDENSTSEDPEQSPPKRKNRQPSKTNKNIDQSRTTVNPDGSTTYYDLQGRPVTYSPEGYPDFSPYAEAEVQVDNLQGSIPPDDKLANQAVGLDSTPDGYTWHHVEDGETMQLVPTDIHSEFPHTGGASIIRSQQ